jgi:signal transduction histidine kinase
LGLYISKLLVERFDGIVGLDSEINKGSTFWFDLPTEEKRTEDDS